MYKLNKICTQSSVDIVVSLIQVTIKDVKEALKDKENLDVVTAEKLRFFLNLAGSHEMNPIIYFNSGSLLFTASFIFPMNEYVVKSC